MKKYYYVFQKHNVIHKISNNTPGPLGQHDLNRLSTTSGLLLQEPISLNQHEYTVELTDSDDLPLGFAATSLRTLLGRVEDQIFSNWCRAAQTLYYYRSNRFCGFCGTQTIAHATEMARLCPACSACYYPRISPCIIVLIHRGDEILLARSPRFRRNMFSTLAGFVEPGESVEEALHREIFEEVAIKVKNLHYFASQPWPFPSQLMLGFFAEYASGTIQIDEVEISEASWYECDRLPEIPGKTTIAGQLIRSYLTSKGLKI
ncbi:MAG: NAD(+) diphosphatase [Desulfocapsaceae bacterium]|nr:NAD(+) diphosphatase [Desulfocapsaceae bacterium]